MMNFLHSSVNAVMRSAARSEGVASGGPSPSEGANRRTIGDFARDDGGVIMIVGVFFTFFWIGMIWYLFGVGNVIAYRENMQNAADAAAFAGAVYNARGMNLLAIINNLMGIALAVLFVMKAAQLVNLFAQGADCHSDEDEAADICVDSWGTACVPAIAWAAYECYEDCENVLDFRGTLDSTDEGVHGVMQAMHTAEALISVYWGWPTIAQGKSVGVAGYYYANGTGASSAGANSGVTGTNSISYSQHPGSIDPNATASAGSNTCPWFPVNKDGTEGSGSAAGDSFCLVGPRCGLPVTTDSYGSVCQAAIDDFTTLGGAFPGVDAAGSYVGGFFYGFMGKWLCDDNTMTGVISGSSFPGINWDFTTAGTVLISVAGFWECTLVNGVESAVTDLLNGGSVSNGSLSLIPMSGPSIPASCPAWSTMKLYADTNGPVAMGLDYFGVWGSATGVYTDINTNSVQMAGFENGKNQKVADLPSDSTTAVARAEFYYDPQGTAGSPDSKETTDSESVIQSGLNFNIEYNVLWNMRWRARLRRFHYMPVKAYMGDIGSVGALQYGEYLTVILQNPSLVVQLGLSGDVPSLSLADVGKQDNKAPFGMFH